MYDVTYIIFVCEIIQFGGVIVLKVNRIQTTARGDKIRGKPKNKKFNETSGKL